MIWIALIIILFIAMLLAPIIVGVYWYRKNNNSVLPVRQNRTRNPRYFANSFEQMFLKAFNNRKDDTLMLSHPERFTFMKNVVKGEPCGMIAVMMQEEEHIPADTHFLKEIYAFGNTWFPQNSSFRAVRTCGNLILESGTSVDRWADASGTIAVYDNCNLGTSLTSETAISLGKNCSFLRIYAPIIRTGVYPGHPWQRVDRADKYKYESVVLNKEWKKLHHVSASEADRDGFVHNSIVSDNDIIVDEGIVVCGSIRTIKSVRIADGAVICGNVFADGEINLGRDCLILGSVFTQGDIYCEEGTTVGREGGVSSIVARGHITFEKNCCVYGYVSNERGATSYPANHWDALDYPEWKTVKYLDIDSLSELDSESDELQGEIPDRNNNDFSQMEIEDISESPIISRLRTIYLSRKKAILFGTLGLAVFLILCTAAAVFYLESAEEEPVSADVLMREELNRNQGLAAGIELDTVPDTISDDKIFFSDRILTRCSWTNEDAEYVTGCIQELLKQVGQRKENVKSYVMTAPLRIGFEESYTEDDSMKEIVESEMKALEELETMVLSETEGLAVGIPIISALKKHEKEYLFYRTLPAWTARGAYYGAQEFIKASGLTPFEIESFYEVAKKDMSGELADDDKGVYDRRIYYTYQNYNPPVEQLTNKEVEPMISLLRGNLGMFIGGRDEYSHFKGLAENNRTVLLIGCRNINVMAPWMVTQFEDIIVLYLPLLHHDDARFWGLIDEYGVTDLLILADADSIKDHELWERLRSISRLT